MWRGPRAAKAGEQAARQILVTLAGGGVGGCEVASLYVAPCHEG